MVRENIVRHVGMGKTHRQAALDGTNEIGLAVLATTFSIVAVFLPVAFMGGIIGRFFHQFGITVAAAVLISLFVTFTLDPMLSSIWHDPQAHGNGRFARIVNGAQERANRVYRAVLGWALRCTRSTLLIALATFVGSFVLPILGTEFVPQADLGEQRISTRRSAPRSNSPRPRRARSTPRCASSRRSLHLRTINTGMPGQDLGGLYLRLVPLRSATARPSRSPPIRERLAASRASR